VRNGFVSGRLHAAGQLFCRLHCLFFHAKILARPAGQPRNALPAHSLASRSSPSFSLLRYFFASSFLSLRTVLPEEPRNSIAEIFIQFLAYY
jgi:hypothetical protein